MERKNFFLITIIVMTVFLLAGKECMAALTVYGDVKAGNRDYRNKKLKEAKESYEKALMRRPGWDIPLFNSGNVLYRQNNFDQAQKIYDETIKRKGSPLAQKAFYNKGNIFFSQKDYQKAIDSYKEALRLKPDDREAKFNLELAMKKMEDKGGNQGKDKDKNKDNKNNKDNKDNKNKKDKNNENNKDNKNNKDKNNKNKDDKNKDDKDKGKGGQQDLPDKGEISRDQALRVLKAFQKNEEDNAKKIKPRYQVRQTEKDW